MLRAVVLALAMAASAEASSNPKIAGYVAGSDVWAHNRIDLSYEAMYSFLNKKYPRGKMHNTASGVALDPTDGFTETVRHTLAHDMYNGGGGKSSDYIKYVDADPDVAMTESPGSYKCKQIDGSSTEIPLGKLAHKSKTGTSAVDLKVYLDDSTWSPNDNYDHTGNDYVAKQCGKIPFMKSDATINGAGTASDGSYTENSIYKVADCPSGATGTLGSGVTVSCSSGSAQTIVFAIPDSTAPSYGSRTLKGFSTQVQAKMVEAAKPEVEAVQAKYFHGTGSYGDTHIQAALKALINQDHDDRAFSTCSAATGDTAEADCKVGDGKFWDSVDSACYAAEKAACPSGATWTQGTALCKDSVTHHLVARNWAGHAASAGNWDADKTLCVDYKGDGSKTGVITNFQEYFDISESGLNGRLAIEVVQKMAAYTNTWLYTVHEFEDAIADCVADAIGDNDAGVHAWDEGVAFWTGSAAGEDAVQDGGTDGVLIYALANKRCKNFHTCQGNDGSGNSIVNLKLFEKFTEGKNAIHNDDCGEATVALRETIVPQMTVPLIQGTLRYAYKIDQESDDSAKSWGEGYAFMMSVIHRVAACSIADANVIYNALDIPEVKSGLGTLGGGKWFINVKEAFEKNYECMGITCADVGALHDSNGNILAGAEACADPDTGAGAGAAAGEEKEVLPTWAIIAIAAAGFLMVLFFGMMCAYKSSKDMTIKMYNDLKKEGARV